MLLAICISSLNECPLKSFAYFLIRFIYFLLLSYRSSLYILDINTLSDTWFANFFSYSVGCLFCSACFLWCKEVFCFTKPVCLFLPLLLVLLVSDPGNHCHMQHHEALPVFFWELYNFRFYILILNSFWVSFCIWIEGGSNFIFLCLWTPSLPSIICWRDCHFPIGILAKIIWPCA